MLVPHSRILRLRSFQASASRIRALIKHRSVLGLFAPTICATWAAGFCTQTACRHTLDSPACHPRAGVMPHNHLNCVSSLHRGNATLLLDATGMCVLRLASLSMARGGRGVLLHTPPPPALCESLGSSALAKSYAKRACGLQTLGFMRFGLLDMSACLLITEFEAPWARRTVRSLIHIVSAPDATEMLISCSCLAAAGDSIDSLFCSRSLVVRSAPICCCSHGF